MSQRNTPIRVIIVEDDSQRRIELRRVLESDADIAVVGQVNTCADALARIADSRPDVLVLDLHLGDGGSRHTIEQVMALSPTPILVLSARIDDRNSSTAVEALVAGALEALPRPAKWTAELGAELRHCVHQISRVPVIRHPRGNRAALAPASRGSAAGATPIVAIAASTGGPSALATLLAGLSGLPAVVMVVQHLHPEFTSGLLEWMTRVSALPVEMAADGQLARPRRVYLAPSGTHLRLGAGLTLQLLNAPVTIHRPSADQLFDSVADYGRSGVGVLLTGMGEDGARGLLAIHRNGGQTLAQDEASCAIFGMPRAAKRLGAVKNLVPLDQLPNAVRRAVAAVAG